MGNLPSNQEPLQAEAKDQNGGLNGHAVAVTDAGTGPHVDKHLLPDGCVPLISAPETSPALPGKDPALVQTNGHQLPEQPESSEPRAPQDAAAAPKLLGEEKVNLFGKMFKKKPDAPPVPPEKVEDLVTPADQQTSPKREDAAPDVGAEKQPEQQMSNGAGPDPAEAPAEAAAKPPPEQKKRFSGLFKKKPESPPAAEPGGPPGGTETPAAANEQPRSSEEKSKHPIADSSGMRPSEKQVNAAAVVTKDDPGSAPKDGDEKPKRFGKLFMKKSGNTPAVEVEISPDQTPAVDVHLQAEPGDIKEGTEPQQDPDRESLDLVPAAAQLAPQPQEHPVMNFFKTLVSPTRTPKEAAAGPDGSREQPQKEPAAAAQSAGQEVDAAKAKVPPPPPPEPPKMAEPAARKEDVKDTPKQAEPAAKPKAAKESPFNKIFRPKVDASKTATLEAAAKPEAPALPAPREEEKKSEKRASPFASFFKPKVLLDQVASRMQAVGISTRIGRPAKSSAAAPEQKKDTPVTAAAPPPEAPQGARAKEDPKSAPPATPPVPDSKPAESAENASPSTARREKRNSIQLFFRNLGQKRHSDAGVQTEAPAAGSTVERGK